MLAEFRINKNERGHTLGISARRVGASLGGSAAGTSGGGGRVGSSCTTAIATPEVRVVTGLLTLGVLLDVDRRASALGTGRDTVVGVIYLVIVGTGHMVALGCAADIRSLA